jgi:hypothetical protein
MRHFIRMSYSVKLIVPYDLDATNNQEILKSVVW